MKLLYCFANFNNKELNRFVFLEAPEPERDPHKEAKKIIAEYLGDDAIAAPAEKTEKPEATPAANSEETREEGRAVELTALNLALKMSGARGTPEWKQTLSKQFLLNGRPNKKGESIPAGAITREGFKLATGLDISTATSEDYARLQKDVGMPKNECDGVFGPASFNVIIASDADVAKLVKDPENNVQTWLKDGGPKDAPDFIKRAKEYVASLNKPATVATAPAASPEPAPAAKLDVAAEVPDEFEENVSLDKVSTIKIATPAPEVKAPELNGTYYKLTKDVPDYGLVKGNIVLLPVGEEAPKNNVANFILAKGDPAELRLRDLKPIPEGEYNTNKGILQYRVARLNKVPGLSLIPADNVEMYKGEAVLVKNNKGGVKTFENAKGETGRGSADEFKKAEDVQALAYVVERQYNYIAQLEAPKTEFEKNAQARKTDPNIYKNAEFYAQILQNAELYAVDESRGYIKKLNITPANFREDTTKNVRVAVLGKATIDGQEYIKIGTPYGTTFYSPNNENFVTDSLDQKIPPTKEAGTATAAAPAEAPAKKAVGLRT